MEIEDRNLNLVSMNCDKLGLGTRSYFQDLKQSLILKNIFTSD